MKYIYGILGIMIVATAVSIALERGYEVGFKAGVAETLLYGLQNDLLECHYTNPDYKRKDKSK